MSIEQGIIITATKNTVDALPTLSGDGEGIVLNGHVETGGITTPGVGLFLKIPTGEDNYFPFSVPPAIVSPIVTMPFPAFSVTIGDREISLKTYVDSMGEGEVKSILTETLKKSQIRARAAVVLIPVVADSPTQFVVGNNPFIGEYMITPFIKGTEPGGFYISRTDIAARPNESGQGTFFEATGITFLDDAEIAKRNIGPNSGDLAFLISPVKKPHFQLSIPEYPARGSADRFGRGVDIFRSGLTQVDIDASQRPAVDYTESTDWRYDPRTSPQMVFMRIVGIPTDPDGTVHLPDAGQVERLNHLLTAFAS